MLTFVVTMGFSQRFIGSVIAGGNMSQVDGDEVFGFKKIGLREFQGYSGPMHYGIGVP